MTLVVHRRTRSRFEMVRPFFERLQTNKHPQQEMEHRCSWSVERNMGHGFDRVTSAPEGCGDVVIEQGRIPS
jgi:hypothetical protein